MLSTAFFMCGCQENLDLSRLLCRIDKTNSSQGESYERVPVD